MSNSFKFVVLTLLITIFVGMYFYFIVHQTVPSQIVKVATIEDLNPPKELHQQLVKANDPLLTTIYYDGNKLYCHDGIKHDLTGNIYLSALQEIIAEKPDAVQPGWYVLAFHDGVHTKPEVPVLAFAGTQELVQSKDVFLMPDPEAIYGYDNVFAKIDNKITQYPWKNKIGRIFWRGAPTGGNLRTAFVNYARTLDIANVAMNDFIPIEDSIAYKYLFNIDGNSCAYSRMAWILYSNSMLMKHQSDKVQWYYNQLQPYVHFVPVAIDFSNLVQQFMWAEQNQDEAEQIALNGRELAQTVFSKTAVLQALEQAFADYQDELKLRYSS